MRSKTGYKERHVKDIKTYSKNKNKKNMVGNNIKISLKMKQKGWLSTEKNIK